MAGKDFATHVSQHLVNNDNPIFIIGDEVDNPINHILSDRMIYQANTDVFNLWYILGLLKANLKIGLLRIGNVPNIPITFQYYINLVLDGGLIVIDNYQQFKICLDYIHIDGKIPQNHSILGKFTTVYCENNKIILRREFGKDDIKFAIVMSTYYRENGKSKAYVERALKFLNQQVYQKFKLFLIGDKYANDQEFNYFRTLLPADKLEAVNLSTAFERERCAGGHNLWCAGGTKAVNHGMDLAVNQGFTHYLHLDDDDYWNTFHLRNIAMGYEQFPEACFIVTMGICDNNLGILPSLPGLFYNNFDCQGARAFHSSFGFRMDVIPFRYTNISPDQANTLLIPGDADMLNRVGTHCRQNNLKILGIPVISCFYETKVPPMIDFLSKEYQNKESLVNEINKSRSDLIVAKISQEMIGKTFHHHYHLLYDLRTLLGPTSKNYMEIGVFNGGSLSLMLQHPYKTNLVGIDLFAFEGQFEAVQNNIARFNSYSRNIVIHKENSHSTEFIEKLKQENCKVDLLFIDGDHSYNGATLDFELFSQFVKSGGYIVFDDYKDSVYSPEVKPAVDDIVKKIENDYEIIGTFPNFIGAFPDSVKEFNEFIIRKL